MIEKAIQLVAIAATFTAELLEEPLAYWMHKLGIQAGIEFAQYNQVFQQLLDPSSLLCSNQDGINVILIRLEDLRKKEDSNVANFASCPEECVRIESNVRDLIAALKAAAGRSGTPFIIYLCPASRVMVKNVGISAFLNDMETLMASELTDTEAIYMVTPSELATIYPVTNCNDDFTERIGNIPFTEAFFISLGTMIARKIFTLRNKPFKVIVLDCDQTLWRGVCGEDGPDGIEIDIPHRALQEFMVAQQNAGMLLCLCSKNNEGDVARVFDCHPEMPLDLDHIVSRRINWKSKPQNLRSLGEELQVGLESFIFIDDDPVECAHVRAECPEVLTLQLPQDSNDIPRFLKHVWAFDHLNTTKEDRQRTRLYKQCAERSRFQKECMTFQDFLAELELKVNISEMSDSKVSRVAQLTQRTNQFNVTGSHRSATEVRRLCKSGALECLTVEVGDRFGDYGLVGVMMFSAEPEALKVDTFLLSCRALGRGVEHKMLALLGEIAKSRQLDRIDIPALPTARNQSAFDFLYQVGRTVETQSQCYLTFTVPVEHAVSLTFNPETCEDKRSRNKETATEGISIIESAQTRSSLLERIAVKLCNVENISKDIESARRDLSCTVSEESYVSPRTLIEGTLAKIWTCVLGIREVDIYDNFFELGGNSLLVVQLMSRIRDKFGIELPMKLFFDRPTISETAKVVEMHLVHRIDLKKLLSLLEEIAGLTDDEIEVLLAEEGEQL